MRGKTAAKLGLLSEGRPTQVDQDEGGHNEADTHDHARPAEGEAGRQIQAEEQ